MYQVTWFLAQGAEKNQRNMQKKEVFHAGKMWPCKGV